MKNLRKVLASALVCATVLTAGATTAFAHGHGGGGCHGGYRSSVPSSTATSYPVCTVAGCNLGYNHIHDGQTYCGHTVGDGHDHTSCTVAGCTQSGGHCHGVI